MSDKRNSISGEATTNWQKPGISNIVTPRAAVRVLKRRWMGMLVVLILSSAAACAWVYRLPAIYRAETVILVESQKIPEKLVSSTVNAELQDRLATISQEVLSATRLQTVIEKFKLYSEERKHLSQEEVIDQMRKDISIKLERGWTRNQPGAFRISLLGGNPEQVAAVVNQLGTYFIEENLRTREIQAESTSQFLTSQLESTKETLAKLEARVAEYKREHNGELPEQQQSLLAGITSMQVQLQGNQDAILRAQQSVATIQGALGAANVVESSLAQTSGGSHATHRTVAGSAPVRVSSPSGESEAAKAGRMLADLQVHYTDQYPEVRRMKARLEQLEKQEAQAALSAAKAAEGSSSSSEVVDAGPDPPAGPSEPLAQVRAKIGELKLQLEGANKELGSRQADRQRILADLASYQRRVENLPLREQDMASLKRDY